jgi:hypothetical protein
MIKSSSLLKYANVLSTYGYGFAFKKFDYEDALNLKSLLN